MTSPAEGERRWSFVTNHARVLAYIASDPNARLRDIAAAVGITERTAAHIVNDLEQAGYLSRTRDGRRNQYSLDAQRNLRHPRLKGLAGSQLVMVLLEVFERQPLG
jgi:DNA-binding MarR family transcriptional regulator